MSGPRARRPLDQCVPKITDFGLAKRLERRLRSDARKAPFMGTPSYMALPSRPRGKIKELGPTRPTCTPWEPSSTIWLTGRSRRFRGNHGGSTRCAQVIPQRNRCLPRSCSPALPPDLQTICPESVCKKKLRASAIQTAPQELAADLRRFLEHRPILARAHANLGTTVENGTAAAIRPERRPWTAGQRAGPSHSSAIGRLPLLPDSKSSSRRRIALKKNEGRPVAEKWPEEQARPGRRRSLKPGPAEANRRAQPMSGNERHGQRHRRWRRCAADILLRSLAFQAGASCRPTRNNPGHLRRDYAAGRCCAWARFPREARQ